MCVRLHKDWVLEELYIEGLRSMSCAEHGPPLLSADRVKNSLFAARKYQALEAAAVASGNWGTLPCPTRAMSNGDC